MHLIVWLYWMRFILIILRRNLIPLTRNNLVLLNQYRVAVGCSWCKALLRCFERLLSSVITILVASLHIRWLIWYWQGIIVLKVLLFRCGHIERVFNSSLGQVHLVVLVIIYKLLLLLHLELLIMIYIIKYIHLFLLVISCLRVELILFVRSEAELRILKVIIIRCINLLLLLLLLLLWLVTLHWLN